MFRLRKHKKQAALALVGIVLVAGCESPSALVPVSPQAQAITNLIWVVFAVAGVVFFVVEGLLIYATVRYSRHRPDEAQTEVNPHFEAVWFAAPAVVLAVIFVLSILLLQFLTTATTGANNAFAGPSTPMLKMKVVGHQWWWEFIYPDLGIVTADEMHIPLGTLVQVDVTSADVIHSFWVPQFAGKIDAIPGQTNHTSFLVNEAGFYHGQCSEFCGLQHAQMYFYAAAEPPSVFDLWVKQEQTKPGPATGDAVAGEKAFMAAACSSCHAIDGTTAKGTLGPNLTHFAGRAYFAGASQKNTSENLAEWLADPQALKPGANMPNLHLSQENIAAIVTYLNSLK